MPLLDGKYEVVGQRQVAEGRTHIDAIAPDGTPVRVEWFDLQPGEEAAFERYRRLLKRLKREGLAAVHDVISRPGARYVAWLKPDPGLARAQDPQVLAVLAEHGYPPSAADVRGRAGKRLLYGLGFGGSAAPAAPPPEEAPAARPLRTAQARTSLLEKASPVVLSWALSGVLLLAAASLTLGAFQRRVVDASVVVPDVLGADVRAAVARLSGLGLGVEVTAVPSESAPGSVVDVEPDVGTELRPGRTVRLGYALAPGLLQQTTAPALIGLSYPEEVRDALRSAGLELGEASHVPASAPAGVVLAQSVDAGTQVGAGQAVDVLVSAGPAPALTFLPNLVGLDVDDARALAALAGVDPARVTVDEVVASAGRPGEVLAQSPAAYRPVPSSDTTVRLVVQAGTAPAPGSDGAPDLVGLTRSRAEQVAAEGGWSVQVQRVATLSLPAGTVVAQTPPPLAAGEDRSLVLVVNVHPVALRDPGVRAVVREPQPRGFDYAWTILPGIGRTSAQVYVTTLEGERRLAGTHTVQGGEILRGTYYSTDPGPLTFELLLGGVPYGDPLLVP